jgi:hypothetical protein
LHIANSRSTAGLGLIHDAMTVIILSLAHRRPAGDDADGVDADLAALLLREMLDLAHPLGGLRYRYP